MTDVDGFTIIVSFFAEGRDLSRWSDGSLFGPSMEMGVSRAGAEAVWPQPLPAPGTTGVDARDWRLSNLVLGWFDIVANPLDRFGSMVPIGSARMIRATGVPRLSSRRGTGVGRDRRFGKLKALIALRVEKFFG